MKMKNGLVLFSWLLFAAMNAFSQDPNFYVFLSFGQSNMEGFPGIEEQDRTAEKHMRRNWLKKCVRLENRADTPVFSPAT
jgi:hypothetical protein